jgi:hypothetical protein
VPKLKWTAWLAQGSPHVSFFGGGKEKCYIQLKNFVLHNYANWLSYFKVLSKVMILRGT